MIQYLTKYEILCRFFFISSALMNLQSHGFGQNANWQLIMNKMTKKMALLLLVMKKKMTKMMLLKRKSMRKTKTFLYVITILICLKFSSLA